MLEKCEELFKKNLCGKINLKGQSRKKLLCKESNSNSIFIKIIVLRSISLGDATNFFKIFDEKFQIEKNSAKPARNIIDRSSFPVLCECTMSCHFHACVQSSAASDDSYERFLLKTRETFRWLNKKLSFLSALKQMRGLSPIWILFLHSCRCRMVTQDFKI